MLRFDRTKIFSTSFGFTLSRKRYVYFPLGIAISIYTAIKRISLGTRRAFNPARKLDLSFPAASLSLSRPPGCRKTSRGIIAAVSRIGIRYCERVKIPIVSNWCPKPTHSFRLLSEETRVSRDPSGNHISVRHNRPDID